VLLVPGQVESDASLAYGAPGIRTNLALLQAVRRDNPDAFIVYKPHPDVVAGLRAKGADEDETRQWCDEVVVDVAMDALLPQVDGVQVLTSLAGFEALLRHKPVTCYGHPFYAGWGLTQDIVALPRRQRRLTLDQLVAGALLLYPLYLSRTGDTLISAEQALGELVEWRSQAGRRVPWWRHCVRFFLRRIVGVR
jgi:capsular polysaccharide export protein